MSDFLIYDDDDEARKSPSPSARPTSSKMELIDGKGKYYRKYRLKHGREIEIRLQDDLERIDVYDSSGNEIGEMDFRHIDDGGQEYYMLMRAYMETPRNSHKRLGIGRAALELFHEFAGGVPLVARDHDGQRQNDGSHLTGDAPAFVAAMETVRLIQTESSFYGRDEDHDEAR